MAHSHTHAQSGALSSRKDFDDDPRGQQQYWDIEIKAALKRLDGWQRQAEQIVDRFIDNRSATGSIRAVSHSSSANSVFRLNLFNANVTTLKDTLYGKLPRIDVSRNDTTGNDDTARVAAEILERLLRLDIEDNGLEYDATLRSVLLDRLLVGLGTARVRYTIQTQGAEILDEQAPVDYYHWSDVLWGWGRTFADLPWLAFRSYLTEDEIEQRFGEKAAKDLQYTQQQREAEKGTATDPDTSDVWQKAEIWEIWDKTTKTVVWYAPDAPKTLDTRDDPLALSGFFPAPPFFIANPTTSLYMPTPDYHLSQDLYNEIDTLQTRISTITQAVKVVGVYDASSTDIKRMLSEGTENDLIPVDKWAVFAEKGGLVGQIEWLPLKDIVTALDRLRALRDETIGLLQQVSGMADVMRGELNNQYEGVGQTQIKAQFGSQRMQALQDSFARFVTDLMQLKAEVIVKHFSAATIYQRAFMEYSYDKDIAPQAIELLKDPKNARFRIEIKAESMAQQDFANLQSERAQYLNGLSTFLQAATPLMQQDPRSKPFLLELLKWGMAGFKGASDIEGVLDKAIEAMNQPKAQEEEANKPSPEQQRAQAQIQLEQIKAQGRAQENQAKLQAQMQIRESDKQADIATSHAQMQADLIMLDKQTQAEMSLLIAKMEADVRTEMMTSETNAQQQGAAVQAEIQKELIKGRIEIEKLMQSKRADAGIKILEKGFLEPMRDRLKPGTGS